MWRRLNGSMGEGCVKITNPSPEWTMTIKHIYGNPEEIIWAFYSFPLVLKPQKEISGKYIRQTLQIVFGSLVRAPA